MCHKFKHRIKNLSTENFWKCKIYVNNISEPLYQELCVEYIDHLPIHTSYLQSITPSDQKQLLPSFDDKAVKLYNKSTLEKIMYTCNKALTNINQDALLIYNGMKNDNRSDASKIKSNMERQKNVLLETLCNKGIAMCRIYQTALMKLDDDQALQKVTLEDISEMWRTLLKFVDPSDKSSSSYILLFGIWHAAIYKHFGRLLKYLQKYLEEKNNREVEEKSIEVYTILGWDHIARFTTNALPTKFPTEYRSF